MAKSKNGGSRAYIRGRIGSDVYSVSKDGKGQKQQVIRSLAVQVANPRSSSQMFNRMVMSTIMQAVSALSSVIDHSFDGIAKGQPSISEFIRRNYTLVKADALAHPSADNEFGLNKFQEKGIKSGKYVVSAGPVSVPSCVGLPGSYMTLTLPADNVTVGALRAALGLSAEGYLTYIDVAPATGATIVRLHVKESLADADAITTSNVATIFDIEGNKTPTIELDTNVIVIGYGYTGADRTYGCIVSEKIDGVWAHNDCTLTGQEDFAAKSDVALPTYPVGSEMFLNGGDI